MSEQTKISHRGYGIRYDGYQFNCDPLRLRNVSLEALTQFIDSFIDRTPDLSKCAEAVVINSHNVASVVKIIVYHADKYYWEYINDKGECLYSRDVYNVDLDKVNEYNKLTAEIKETENKIDDLNRRWENLEEARSEVKFIPITSLDILLDNGYNASEVEDTNA